MMLLKNLIGRTVFVRSNSFPELEGPFEFSQAETGFWKLTDATGELYALFAASEVSRIVSSAEKITLVLKF
jgi:hypothetical protein